MTTISPAPTRPSAHRTVPVRRLDVDLKTADVPRWLVDDDPIFSHFLATLSSMFPRGEEFFVETVRARRGDVADDPVLKAQVKGFIGQESMHGREHRDLNGRLEALGYAADRTESELSWLLDRMVKIRPASIPLAMTAAAEHFTGILAEAVLGDDQTREVLFSHPDLQSLISWHALEELEHKNVAFDVFERSGGGYIARMTGFGLTVGVLGGYLVSAWVRGMAADRKQIGRRERRRFRANMARQKMLSPWALRQMVRYLRPGFHPDDMETEHLVEEWRVRLEDRTTPNRKVS